MDYQKLFEHMPEPFILFESKGPEYIFVDVSDAHSKMTGVPRDQLIGRPFFEVFPDNSEHFKKTGKSEIVEDVFKVVVKTKQAVESEPFRYDIKGLDGTFLEKYWQTVHYPVFDNTGNVKHILQLSKDVTESRTVEEKLVETEEDLERALEAGVLAMWDWNVKDDILTGSGNLAVFFGVPQESVEQGLPLEAFTSAIHEDDRERVLAEIQKTIELATPFESEYRTMSHDGTVRWVIARGRLEHDAGGSLAHFPGLIIDITARKQAEFNATFMSKASKILASSLDYKKTIENVALLSIPDIADWCTVTIASDEGVLEQVAVAHKDPEKREWARQYAASRTMTTEDPSDVTARVIRSGKAEFYEYISDEMLKQAAQSQEESDLVRNLELRSLIVVPIHERGKNIGTVTLILTGEKRRYSQSDVGLATELADRISVAISNARLYEMSVREVQHRKQLQQELRRANKDLEQRVERRTAQLHESNENLKRSNGELQNFAYVASHDLQEPLRKIQAFGDILDEEYAETLGEGADYLKRMRAAASRMSLLIEDLLSFSRVTTHANPFVDVDLSRVLTDVIDDLETRIASTHGTVNVPESLPHVQGDATQLRQLLQNLIANALKFHKPNESPVVTVTADTNDEMVRFSVADNGIGFDQKYTDRIFTVFQRLHSKEDYEGTGIGLAVCKKIVERHGGTINAESTPGSGARFIVELPLHATA